jgi:hypothetical protein
MPIDLEAEEKRTGSHLILKISGGVRAEMV